MRKQHGFLCLQPLSLLKVEGFPPGRSERENSYTLKSHDHGLLIRYFVRVAFF
jgi:hypothetical protein